MSRIIFSLALIVMVTGALGYGATKAFFSDTETAVANVLTAGAVDLKVDNESYYNGVFNDATSWKPKDLGQDDWFFNFDDLKPGDYGEDTISLHVDTNDAYMCANVTLTSNDDNGFTEPEALVDQTPGPEGEGELAALVNFVWWADDGDNVLEDDEEVISEGPIGDLPLDQAYPIALADSDENIWTGQGGPFPGDETQYIGKAWCFGEMGTDPLDPGNYPSPADDNDGNQIDGEPEDGGITCDGSLLGNESQTDSLTADIEFSVVQARHNQGFQCDEASCDINELLTLIPGSGFENPEVENGAGWDIFDSPAGAWNVAWRNDIPATFGDQTRPNPAHLEIHENVLGTATEGDQYAELDTDWGGPNGSGDGEPASVTIYQDIATVPGKNYRIKFAFAPRPNTVAAENRLEVKWDGGMVHDTGYVADPNSGIEWQQITVDVVATSNLTRLEFTDLGTANSMGTFVDDFRLYTEECN
jgi:hypothetical protein